MYKPTTALKKIQAMEGRLRIVQGGARAGKSIAILLILIAEAQSKGGLRISVVSESMPHLKRGVIRDFIDIMQKHDYFKEDRWNKTDKIYTYETGSFIEFFSADDSGKVRGPARDILFINEANGVPYEIYTQLALRTSDYIFLDYNPVAEFWVHDELIPNHVHSYEQITYLDNEYIPPEIRKELLARKDNKNFWQIFGLGELGDFEGKIFKDWKIIDEIPHEARLEVRGLDFGFSNDPAVIVDIYKYNQGFIVDEQLHSTGFKNRQIAEFVNNLYEPKTLMIADSAEPKSIDEISEFGINIIGAEKGPGSVNAGINYVQDQRMSITKRSVGTIKDYRNYLWQTDKIGKQLNKPSHDFSDGMDAIRYGMEYFSPNDNESEEVYTTGDFSRGLFG